jgi:hypothetical protein
LNKAKTNVYQPAYKKNEPTEDPQETLKRKIRNLCDSLNPLLKTAEDYQRFVNEKTGFELVPVNYVSIVDTLKTTK